MMFDGIVKANSLTGPEILHDVWQPLRCGCGRAFCGKYFSRMCEPSPLQCPTGLRFPCTNNRTPTARAPVVREETNYSLLPKPDRADENVGRLSAQYGWTSETLL